jgi:hypothetical protein
MVPLINAATRTVSSSSRNYGLRYRSAGAESGLILRPVPAAWSGPATASTACRPLAHPRPWTSLVRTADANVASDIRPTKSMHDSGVPRIDGTAVEARTR